MKAFFSLINREFWEQRGVFFTLPVVIGIFMVFLSLIAMLTSFHDVLHHFVIYDHASASISSGAVQTFLMFSSIPFMVVLWLTVAYYYIGSLYDDRKDKSILFWQSMPVSENKTVLSKIVAGNVLAPFCAWVCMMVVQLILMAIATIILWFFPEVHWVGLWQPQPIITAWVSIFYFMLVQGLWLLPLFAWCMFSGSYANKAPAIRAIVPVLLLMLADVIFTHAHYFILFVTSRFAHAASVFNTPMPGHHHFVDSLAIPGYESFVIGLLVSLVFFVGAVLVRRRVFVRKW